jgi:hypothetical protein
MIKTIEQNGKKYRFGANLHSQTIARWCAHDYLNLSALPTPPASVSWITPAQSSLSQVFDNDVLGDCVIAASMHQMGLWTGNAGKVWIPTNAQVLADYGAIGGYIPGKPDTDQGCDPEVALSYYTSHGWANGAKLAGWMGVDATNQTLVKQCILLFESFIITLNLPDAWANSMPQASGFVWDVAGKPNASYGHEVMAVGYDAQGVLIATWGMTGVMTWAALAKYCTTAAGGGCYTAISQAALAAGQQTAPNMVDWPQIIADFQSAGGQLPVPNPAPTPTPPAPTPTPVPVPPGPTPTPGPPAWLAVLIQLLEALLQELQARQKGARP